MRRMFFLSLFMVISVSLNAQKSIKLTSPVFSKHDCIDNEDTVLKIDDVGRIISLCYGEKFNKMALINREEMKEYSYVDGKIQNEKTLHDFELKRDSGSFSFQENSKENFSAIYNFSSGVLKKYYYYDGEIHFDGYYVYKLNENNSYLVSSCNYTQTLKGKMSFDDYINTIECSEQIINQLKTANEDVNKYNAEILIWNGFEALIPFLLLDEGIVSTPNSYEATSELKEKNTVYSAENLRNITGLPWASANGFGIGDTITIILPRHCLLKLDFYNGFQSDKRKYLYKANSRAKKIRIKNLDSGISMDVVLEDKFEKQTIDIKDLALYYNIFTTIEITILEVYPGDKYKDLCIQAIIPVY